MYKRQDAHPFYQNALANGIANNSALSRKIRPDIEQQVGEVVSDAAIKVALGRIEKELHPRTQIDYFALINDLSVQTNLRIYNVPADIPYAPRKLMKGEYMMATQGRNFTTVITNAANVSELSLRDEWCHNARKLSAITFHFTGEHNSSPGLIAFVLTQIANLNVNILEVVSALGEFTVVLKPEYADDVFAHFHKLMRR